MICSYCNTNNREDAKFCNECGRLLANTTEEQNSSEESSEAQSLNETSDETSDVSSSSDSMSAAELIELASLELKALGEQTEKDSSEIDLQDKTHSSSVHDSNNDEMHASQGSSKSFTHEADKTVPLDPTPPAAYAPVQPKSYSNTNDLSGIDECLVDPSYTPPQKAWRGSTMEMKAVKDDGTEKTNKPKEHKAPKTPTRQPLQKKSRYALIIGIGLAAVVIALLCISYALELWGGKIIPDVTGKTQVDAEYLLQDKGFTVETNEVHSDETQGIVLYATPEVGDRSASGTPVIINVSIPRVIPDIADSNYDDIIDALHDQGISNITTKEERSSKESGLVLNITPQPGSIVKAADEIVVTVAVPFAVPNVLGLSYEEAQKTLDSAGYDTTVVYDTKESDRNNIVLFTDPAPDSLLEPGSTVTLTISQSRGATLIDETNKFLQDLQKTHEPLFTTDGRAYLIKTIDSVKSAGNETTNFVATATTTLDTQTELQIKGTIVWDTLNYIVSIDVDS